MDVVRFGLGMRALRLRRGWTQEHLGALAGVSASTIVRIERGRADRLTFLALMRVAGSLEARIDVRLLWHGEGLDRLLDAGHARLVDRTVSMLDGAGWDVAAEVTFAVRGERGSIDVLAFHPPTQSLLMVEVKSVVPDLQSMLASIDRKRRLAAGIGASKGWRSTTTSSLLVLPDDRTVRRRLDVHAATFRSAFPARTIQVRGWLRQPSGALAGILFVSDHHHATTRHRVSRRRSSS